jgi:hypothetical protein
MKLRTTAAFVLLCMAGGCASEYTIVDRSSFIVSDNARVTSRDLIPGGDKHPKVIEHLALAQEVFVKQDNLLKERRNKVRARRRALDLTTFGVMIAGALAEGALALNAANKADPKSDVKLIGGLALGGAGLGTGLMVGGLMQEDVTAVDNKINHLHDIYRAMIEHLRSLAQSPESDKLEADMGMAIEAFINEALQINVKG